MKPYWTAMACLSLRILESKLGTQMCPLRPPLRKMMPGVRRLRCSAFFQRLSFETFSKNKVVKQNVFCQQKIHLDMLAVHECTVDSTLISAPLEIPLFRVLKMWSHFKMCLGSMCCMTWQVWFVRESAAVTCLQNIMCSRVRTVKELSRSWSCLKSPVTLFSSLVNPAGQRKQGKHQVHQRIHGAFLRLKASK